MNHSSRLATEDAPARAVPVRPEPVRVFDGILVPYQTPVRRSLPEWATTIHGRFLQAVEQRRLDLVEGASPLVNCFNEAALIEVCFGRQDQAAALCSAYLQWVNRNSRRPGALVILQYAFEPFLNLARIARIQQRYEDALRSIEVVDKVARCQDAWLGDILIPASLSEEIFARSTPFPKLIRVTYILEWVKALIKCKRYSEAEAFNPPWHNPADLTARDIIWEGKIISLGCEGRYDDALAAAEPALADRDGLNRSLFLFRRAETYAAAGRIEDAARVAGGLAKGFLSYPPGSLSMTRMGLLVRLTALLIKLGIEDALRLAELGLQRATALSDILFQSEFLNLMADLQGNGGMALRAEAAERRRKGLYGAGRNSSQNPPSPVEVLTQALLRFAAED
ncbi:MAG TPA: hypothetical protein VFQ41_25040 [Candidatus Angelobacter sp.]|nr:hypothetical protein [Candidatus Angelobacter sp.]